MGAGPALGALILALALPGCWGCVAFSERIITTLADGANSVFAIDVDGDGTVDVLSSAGQDAAVTWYENDGSFTKEDVITDSMDSANSVLPIDVDGDGDVDALSSGSTSFTERIITTLADFAYSVFAIDVDGDGDVDVLSASFSDDTVAWYENDGSQSFTERVITTLAEWACSVSAIDVDGDGDVDALSASYHDDTIAWYEYDAGEDDEPPVFAKHVITTLADEGNTVFAVDLDGDGDVDALSASYNDDTVAWYENDGSQSFARRIITNSADAAISVFAIDVDGDGDVDALSASRDDDTVAWYENDGSQSFTDRAISNSADGRGGVYAIDLDGDGDVDVLSASQYDDTVAWYENDASCASTHLSCFAVAAVVVGGSSSDSLCRRLRAAAGSGLYGSRSYKAWLLAQLVGWAALGLFAADQAAGLWVAAKSSKPRSPRHAVLLEACSTPKAQIVAPARPRARCAYFAFPMFEARDRVVCVELGADVRALAVYDAGGPLLLFVLSAIAARWLQVLSGEAKCRSASLHGDTLKALCAWNGAYAVAAAASTAALVALAGSRGDALAVGRAMLVYLAAAHGLQGLGYVAIGRRFLARLDAVRSTKPLRKPPAPPSAKVVEFNAIYARSAGRFARESPIPRASPDPRASGPGPSPPPFDLRNSPPADGAASEGLPAGWESAYDAASQCFYYRSPALGVSQWERPAPNRRASAGAALRKTPSADGAALHSPRRGSV
ncbi:6-phosphogluconolactonase [Aureococcus anophagefferens]|nr:6-phosphogluconolactonase [Aureococcus anophagefferens]